jgi:hypothetical protein
MWGLTTARAAAPNTAHAAPVNAAGVATNAAEAGSFWQRLNDVSDAATEMIDGVEHSSRAGWHTIEDTVARSLAQGADTVRDVPVVNTLVRGTNAVTNFTTEVIGGLAGGATSLLTGAAHAIVNPLDTINGLGSMVAHTDPTIGLLSRLAQNTYGVATGERDVGSALSNTFDMNAATQQNASYWSNVATQLAQPYVESAQQGHPGEIVGRGAFDIAAILGGSSSRATNTTRAVDLGSDLRRATTNAERLQMSELRMEGELVNRGLMRGPRLTRDMMQQYNRCIGNLTEVQAGREALDHIVSFEKNPELLAHDHPSLDRGRTAGMFDGTNMRIGMGVSDEAVEMTLVHEGRHGAFFDGEAGLRAARATKKPLMYAHEYLIHEGRSYGAEIRYSEEAERAANATGNVERASRFKSAREGIIGYEQYEAAYRAKRDELVALGRPAAEVEATAREAGAEAIGNEVGRRELAAAEGGPRATTTYIRDALDFWEAANRPRAR